MKKLLSLKQRGPPAPCKKLNELKKEVDIDDHRISIAQLCERYSTHPQNGLTSEKAKSNLARDGPNALTPPKRKSWWTNLIKNMFQGFSILLWIGAGLCFVAFFIEYSQANADVLDLDNLYLAAVLSGICIITGIFSYFQERKTGQIIESFKKMVPLTATVIRDGKRLNIRSRELVMGDLVEIRYGDQIPADIRLIQCTNFKVDNSSFTGESEPQLRDAQISTTKMCLEATNLAFSSSNAVEGFAKGIVILVGNDTVIGRIAGITVMLEPKESPIAKELEHFIKVITCWAMFLGIFFFICTAYLGYGWLDSSIFLIGVIVANVPEGLLATVTVCLSLTAKRMAAKNCIVKNLEAVETLGSTSVICSDKTGTLTQNQMTVTHVSVDKKIFTVNYTQSQTGLSHTVHARKSYQSLLRCAVLCSRAEFASDQDTKEVLLREVDGDASEAAILKFAELATSGNVKKTREQHDKVQEIPFNSNNKFQVSLHSFATAHILVMKGAPERILDRCSTLMFGNNIVDLTKHQRNDIEDIIEELGSYGERVIGFCELLLNPQQYPRGFQFTVNPENFPLNDLCFLGVLSMIDPPRPGVPDAVAKCRTAGIRVVMVTGDHPGTAKAIAKAVGIISEGSKTREEIAKDRGVPVSAVSAKETTTIVIQGSVLHEMSVEQLEFVLRTNEEIVFSRTSPIQKLNIVEGFQNLGAIVAVTGDGVNDSPALKKADIGIAMGMTGSDVSKQAADMILLDDNFASIITAIEEGRLIFDNLKKSITYTLASNVPEIIPFLLFVLLSIPLPIGIVAVLCVDLGTDLWPAISLAYEKAESDIMLRPPRMPQNDRLVTWQLLFVAYSQIGFMETCGAFFSYFLVMAENGFFPRNLMRLRARWDSIAINDLMDHYGQEWSYHQRKTLEYNCHTAFFISIVVVQWADLLTCKTRYNSIFKQGMKNWMLNFGIVLETFIAGFVCYWPASPHVFKTYPIKWSWWLPAVPFAFLIFIYDEFRKLLIRRYPNGWIKANTYS